MVLTGPLGPPRAADATAGPGNGFRDGHVALTEERRASRLRGFLRRKALSPVAPGRGRRHRSPRGTGTATCHGVAQAWDCWEVTAQGWSLGTLPEPRMRPRVGLSGYCGNGLHGRQIGTRPGEPGVR